MFVTFHPKHMRPDYKPNISLYLTMREMEMLLLDLRIILILSNGPPKNDITRTSCTNRKPLVCSHVVPVV